MTQKIIKELNFLKKVDEVRLNLFNAVLDKMSIAVVDAETGEIYLTSIFFSDIFEYDADELIGQNVDILIPERLREKHTQHRKEFFKDLKQRMIGREGYKLIGLTKNKNEFRLNLGLTPVIFDNISCVVAIIYKGE